eukprot:427470_1
MIMIYGIVIHVIVNHNMQKLSDYAMIIIMKQFMIMMVLKVILIVYNVYLIKKINRENNDLLYKSYDILMVKHIEMERISLSICGSDMCIFMKERICDLKSECNNYLKIFKLNNLNAMDLKQQTALYTHQILEHWQKIFDKLSSIINIKSYTIEILYKNVSQIIECHNNNEDIDLIRENKNLLN